MCILDVIKTNTILIMSPITFGCHVECHYDFFSANFRTRNMKTFYFIAACWILWISCWRFLISDGARKYFLTRSFKFFLSPTFGQYENALRNKLIFYLRRFSLVLKKHCRLLLFLSENWLFLMIVEPNAI